MKTRVKMTLSIITLSMLFMVSGCKSTTTKSNSETDEHHQQIVQYTCSMHPEVIQSEPGNCPECGMVLIENSDFENEENAEEEHSPDGHNH